MQLSRCWIFIFTNCFVFGLPFISAVVSKSKVKLENNRYTGLVIAINPNITEDSNLIDAIKNAWTEASPALFAATRNRAYFGDITILVPPTWASYSTYIQASGETYDKADVLVADPNPSYGDAPYSLQYGGCGSYGSYIHLTPNYLTDDTTASNFGSRGKVIVHEWAHYRWGIFDETSSSDPFYIDPESNTLYDIYEDQALLSYTQCGKNIEVCCLEQDWQTCDPNLWNPGQSHCAIDFRTGLYAGSCTCYIKNTTNVYDASVMSYQYVDSIFAFCEDTTDPSSRLKHNKYAPNDQNRLCNMRSTWSVILESTDFSGANGPISMATGFDPTFNVKFAAGNQRFVLIIDTSGSMGDLGTSGETRLVQATKAANYFITKSAPSGSFVGIVGFATDADKISGLVQLNNENDRKNLAAKLPEIPNGGTCIGCGIEMGIDVLETKGVPAGGYLLVMTDGEENRSPYVRDVRSEVITKKVVVESLMIYTDKNEDLADLSIESGGDWFFAESDDLLALIDAYNAMAVVETGDETQKKLEILSETVKMGSGVSSHENLVNIDFTIGNNTVFTYTWSYGTTPPEVTITPPNGSCTISTKSSTCTSEFDVDADHKTLTAIIPGRAEVGVWKSKVELSTASAQTIVIVVTSMAADANTPPIKVESSLEIMDNVPVVYAKVTQGFNPVLGAKVTATLSKEGGVDLNATELYDKGAAPDIRKNDGIYSRYVMGIEGGRYSVKVHVDSSFTGYEGEVVNYMFSAATYNPGYVTPSGTVVANPNGPSFLPKDAAFGITSDQLGNFSRQASAGAFEYTPPTSPGGGVADLLPPSKVIDLKVAQNDFNNFTKGIALTFTAPGDDFDSGKAARYEIRLTTGNVETLLNDFTSNTAVGPGDVIEGDISNPQTAGGHERIVVETPAFTTGNSSSISFGFALRAIDEAINVAEVSNVATLRYYIKPPAFAAPSPSTIQPTTAAGETTLASTIFVEPTTVEETTTNGQAETTTLATTDESTSSDETTAQTTDQTASSSANNHRSTTSLTARDVSSATIPSPTSSANTDDIGTTTVELQNSTNDEENSTDTRTEANTTLNSTSNSTSMKSSRTPTPVTSNFSKSTCKDCSDKQDLTWLYITIPVVVVVLGGGIGIAVWFKVTGRWKNTGDKTSRSVSPQAGETNEIALDEVENGERGEDRSPTPKNAW